MPLQKCEINGQSGWQFGNEGKCYVGENAREQALEQAKAIEASKTKDIDILEDKETYVNRFDVFEITESNMVEPFRKTPEGYLRGRAIVTNTGIFNYKQQDGTILRELRTPEDIGNQETLDSLIMQIMTDDHPSPNIAPEGVNADNAKKLQVGFTGESVRFDGHSTSIPITITDAKTIEKVEREGKIALSCGYRADLEMKSGFAYGNNQYDAVQKNIKYNHIAIVNRGRAGDLAKIKLRMDSMDAIRIDDKKNTGGKIMAKVKINDVEFEADQRVAEEFNIVKKLNEDFEIKLKDKNVEFSKLQATHDSLVDKLKTANDEIEKLKQEQLDESKIQEAVKNRIALVDVAVKQNVEITETMNDSDIKKAIILKAFPNAKLEEKNNDYINARYDSAIELLAEKVQIENKTKIVDIKPTQKNDKTLEELERIRISNLYKLTSDQADNWRNGIITDEMKKILEGGK